MQAKAGDTVRVHYTGTLLDGTPFDSSAGRDPLEFTIGACQVIPGFENAVIGLEPGGSTRVEIAPEEAYGPKHEQLVQVVSLKDFASEPYVGGTVNLVSPDGDELPGRITAIEGDAITLDFNHPLAGETLVFEIDFVSIGDAGITGDPTEDVG
jgi:peptidylprolyl isomerase